MDNQGLWVHRESEVFKVFLVAQGTPGLLVHLVLQERPVPQALMGSKETRGRSVWV